MHWLLLVFLAAGESSGIPVELHCAAECASAEIEIAVVRDEDEVEIHRQKVNVSFTGNLPVVVPLNGHRLDVHSEKMWAAPVALQDLPPGDTWRVELFERGNLKFTEEATPGVPVATAGAEAITLEAVGTPVPGEKTRFKKTRLACVREQQAWLCPAPALRLDLRIEKPGHAPLYFWGTQVPPGKLHDLGRLRFRRGASISGFVTVDEGEPEGTKITAAPVGAWLVQEEQRRELQRTAALANERGFFQLHGVAPGGYRLEGQRPGLTTAEVALVEVHEGRETVLADALHLPLPAVLELHVSPPISPIGKSWNLRLIRTTPDSNVAAETLEGSCDENGLWVSEGLRPGSYILDVSNADGEGTGAGPDSSWFTQDLDLHPGREALYVDIPVIAVEGTFQAGDEPVKGRLIFGGFHGMPHIAIWSNEDGEFEGALSREGEWALDAEVNGELLSLEKVLVEPRGGRPARLDIRLPDTRFHGKVTHKGKPVEGAELWGISLETGRSARFDCKSDAEGLFDLRGLHPGRYSLTASSARLRLGAPKLMVDIREGADDPPLEIELEGFVKIEGQVLAGGQPVPLAQFRAILRARGGEDNRQGQATAAGVFGLRVPDSTREIGLVVASAGFTWQIVPLRPGAQGFQPAIVELAQNGGRLRIQGTTPGGGRISYGGIEVPLYLLRSAMETFGYYRSTEEGIVLENAAPGPYRVCDGNNCVEGMVQSGSSLDLNLESPEGGREPEKNEG